MLSDLNSRPERANLVRLLRPQLRAFVQLPVEQWDTVQQRGEIDTTSALLEQADPFLVAVTSTVALLQSSPRLTHNLSSLSYHHYPGPIAHTNPQRNNRNTIVWKAAHPEAARKAHDTNERRQATRKTYEQGADQALGECVQMAEGQRKVLLGRM